MSKLRDQFHSECNTPWMNDEGEPDIDYVLWLEALIENLQQPVSA
jgi:hypothetical protein